jgi:hypothetical protein
MRGDNPNNVAIRNAVTVIPGAARLSSTRSASAFFCA